MRQQMVLNAVHDAGEQWAAEAGNAAALRAYTEARAEAQTVSAYRAIGRQAEPGCRCSGSCSSASMSGPSRWRCWLMLTPAGTAIFRSYVTGLIWLQSWGPLYAVLHRISMGEAAERMQAAALMPGGDIGISLVAQAGIRAVRLGRRGDVGLPLHVGAVSGGCIGVRGCRKPPCSRRPCSRSVRTRQARQPRRARPATSRSPTPATTPTASRPWRAARVRTSAHVDTDRYTGYAPMGAAMTVTGDGTVVADGRAATSRIPAAGVRLSESLATSHETRAAEARTLSRHWSAEAGMAPQRRRHRRDRADRALFARRLHRRGLCAWRHREREHAGAGPGTRITKGSRRLRGSRRTRRRC